MGNFLRRFGIRGLSLIALFCVADRADAIYLRPSHSHPAIAGYQTASDAFSREMWYNYTGNGDYLDRTWYYLLDKGQYCYLDRRQYNLMGESTYLLGHPCYPKLFERVSEQAVGFEGRIHTGWFDSSGVNGPIFELVMSYPALNAGDDIDKLRYDYLDKGQYLFLDKGQYNLLGGLGYLLGRSLYPARYDWYSNGFAEPVGFHAPEPCTITFLGLGALAVVLSRRHSGRAKRHFD